MAAGLQTIAGIRPGARALLQPFESMIYCVWLSVGEGRDCHAVVTRAMMPRQPWCVGCAAALHAAWARSRASPIASQREATDRDRDLHVPAGAARQREEWGVRWVRDCCPQRCHRRNWRCARGATLGAAPRSAVHADTPTFDALRAVAVQGARRWLHMSCRRPRGGARACLAQSFCAPEHKQRGPGTG